MGGGLRAPLRLLAAALALMSALVVVQTLVLRALSYDSSAFGALTVIFRVGFVVADASAFVALFFLGRREPAIYPFSVLALVTLGLMLFGGLLGVALHGTHSGYVSFFAALEPVLSCGTAILVVLALGAAVPATAIADPKRIAAMTAAILIAVVILGLRLSGPSRSSGLTLAWARWAFAVVQPASLAVVALLVARHLASESASVSSAAAEQGPRAGAYRGSSEGGPVAVAAVRPNLVAPTPALIDPMKRAENGIALHRNAFIIRVAMTVIVAFMSAISTPYLIFIALLAGAITSFMMIVGIARQRALPTFEGGKSVIASMIAFGISAAMDLCGLAVVAAIFTGDHRGTGVFVVPTATFFTALGIMLVSRAHARGGDLLFRYRLAGRARWTQGFVVLTATCILASLAALNHVDHHSSYSDRSVLGALLIGLLIVSLASAVACVTFHLLTLTEASVVLRTRIAQAEGAVAQSKESPT